MKKKLLFSLVLVGCLGLTVFALADSTVLPNPLCLNGPTLPNGQPDPNCITTPTQLIYKIANAVSIVIGALGLLMFVWAGALFLFSAGRPEMITKARNALFYAAIGVIVSLAGEGIIALVRFVLQGY